MWRVRAGIGKTFGPLFLMLSVLLILIGVMELHNAWAEPLTADGGQVILGSVSLAGALALFGFLWRQSR
jgi:hypothetical protein